MGRSRGLWLVLAGGGPDLRQPDRRPCLLPSEATGNAGSVTLAADKLRLSGGTIATNAEAADGGSVTIEARDLVHLDAGVITATVTGGDGGDITIDPEVVILQNGSRIVASAATTGSGGDIQITADNYFAFPGSVGQRVVGARHRRHRRGEHPRRGPRGHAHGPAGFLPRRVFADARALRREKERRARGELRGARERRDPGRARRVASGDGELRCRARRERDVGPAGEPWRRTALCPRRLPLTRGW